MGALLVAVSAGTNVPVPLLLVHQQQLGLTDEQTAGLFGVYAIGLIPAVLVAGAMTDRWGARRVVLTAGLVAALISTGFALAGSSVVALFALRAVQGGAAGAVFVSASVWIQQLLATRGPGRGARVAAVCMSGGFAGGSLVAGLWGEWWPWPVLAPYLIHAGACALIAWWTAVGVPAARVASDGSRAMRGPVIRSGARRRALLVVAPPALFVFGFPATAINAVPLVVGLPVAAVAVTGGLAALTLGSGAVVSTWQARLRERAVPMAGLLGAIGMALTAAATVNESAKLLLVPAVIALGSGGGLALSGGLARIPDVVAPGRAGTATAGFYAIAYLGFGIPILVTRATAHLAPEFSFLILGGFCVVVWLAQRPRPTFTV
ncbi:hypothetical protein ASG73_00915 [Janibacter sp. Soil728]|nr:hypothetical protein ASG73_00915 [Janibacter sp. Soil728]